MKTIDQERVRRHTSDQVNQRIDGATEATVEAYARAPQEVLTRRIQELDREWDIERALQTNASLLALLGLGLASFRDRRWLALSGGVLGFLLLHGTQGWCPPLPVLRRAGVRTRSEIERERFALKYLRGDFEDVMRRGKIDHGALLEAVKRR
jgi:hypothetical protein